jgi:cytochrome c oxidase subunit 2
MNNRRALIAAAASLALVAAVSVDGQKKDTTAAPGAARVVEMTARKFDFVPAEVRIKAGTTVTLKVTATDRRHGIEISPYPEGGSRSAAAGLRFAGEQRQWTLEKDATEVIQFTALRPGKYRIECSIFCGLRHNDMEGWIVVE